MNFKKLLLISFILNGVLIFSAYTQGQCRGNFMMGDIEFIKKVLNLDDNQTVKINTIINDSINQIERKHIEFERARLDLKEALLDDNSDLTKIKGIIDKKNAIKSDIEFMCIKKDLMIKSILTPEQLAKWKAIKKHSSHGFFNGPSFHPIHEKGFFNDKEDMNNHNRVKDNKVKSEKRGR